MSQSTAALLRNRTVWRIKLNKDDNHHDKVKGRQIEGESNDWIAEIEAALQAPLDDDDDCYARSVTIDIPPAQAELYGISSVTLSIRDVISLVAQRDAIRSGRLLALRDACYGGDQEDDYAACADDHHVNPTMTSEERSMARFERAKGKDKREEARIALEAAEDPIGPVPDKFSHWKPFNAERWALEAEREALDKRWDDIDLEWDRFVAERATWQGDFTDQEARRRAEIKSKEDGLIAQCRDWEQKVDLLGRRLDSSFKAASTARVEQ